jgi:hypothetical protein
LPVEDPLKQERIKMKYRIVPTLTLLLLLLAACQMPGVTPPTSTPVPSATSEPTSTPLPTDTPTQVPTSTPDKTATAAIQATERSADVLSELEDLMSDTGIPYEQGHLAWRQSKPAVIDLHGPAFDYMEIDRNVTARNFIFKSDVTWNATGPLFCGALFRSEPDLEKGRQYQFLFLRFSGLPAWALDFKEFGRFKNSLTGVEYSDAIDLGNNATNQFILVAQEEQFNVFLNGQSQGRFFDNSKQSMEGIFAFLGLQDSGDGSCEYENSWIWVMDE